MTLVALPVVNVATAAYDQQSLALRMAPIADQMQACPISATTTLGTTGAPGDYLEKLVIVVAASGATAVVSIKDGTGSAMTVLPAVPAIGTYVIPIGKKSETGGWQVTTLAGATVLAFGKFS